MPVILTLDSALGACAAGLFKDGVALAAHSEQMDRGQAARLPAMVEQLLAGQPQPGLVAATVGPGSFTGIRACLALAHGLAAAWGCAVIGVRVDEALLAGAGEAPAWVAINSRPGRVFLTHDGILGSYALDDLPQARDLPMLLGNAAVLVAERLATRAQAAGGVGARFPALADIARLALARHAGALPPLEPQPLYVDAPEARAAPMA